MQKTTNGRHTLSWRVDAPCNRQGTVKVACPIFSFPFFIVLTQEHGLLLAAVVASAFLGTFIGNRLAKKTTLRSIQAIVTITLIAIAIGLGSGLI